jgi:preprotein translocase subunit SecB
MEEENKRTAMSLVAEVAATVEIGRVRYLCFSAKHDPTATTGAMAVEFKHKTTARAEGPDDPRIVVLAEFLMEARLEQSDAAKPCCEIGAALELTYRTAKAMEFTREQLDAFGMMNGIYNAWPYWREFVQNATARMGLPTLIVPSFRFAAAPNDNPKSPDLEPQQV